MSDQTAILQEVLEAVKKLQVNQAALSSNVDAISGRVNVLAGMKEVRDGAKSAEPSIHVRQNETLSSVDESDDAVPQSPSLPVAQLAGDGANGSSIVPSHARKSSTGATSRIILT